MKNTLNMLYNLPLNETHRELPGQFRSYLQALGYSAGSCRSLPSGVREFLHRMEAQGLSLAQAGPQHIKAHYDYLLQRPSLRGGAALSPCTIEGYLYGLRLFFGYAQKRGLVQANPMATLSFPRHQVAEREVLSPAEVKLLYAACCDEQERALLGLFYGCGLRRMEAERLNIRDVDLRGGWLYVRQGKGKRRRVVPISKEVSTCFKNYLYYRPQLLSYKTTRGHAKAFMLNHSGTRMRGNTYWKRFRAIIRRCGNEAIQNKNVSLHHLRHSIATHLLQNGMSMEQVRDFLGHQFLETTQGYTRMPAEALAKVSLNLKP